MKLSKYIALSLVTIASLAIAKPALATEATQEQEFEQKCELTCEVGAYGQSNCTNTCYQEGKQVQTITLSDGTVIYAHQPINTGLDMNAGFAVASLAATGLTALIARLKLV